jgi:replicative DNA helicase
MAKRKEQVAPQAVDPKHLEMAVLGYILTYPQRFYEVQELAEFHFLDPTRRMVFRALKELHEKHGPAGLETPSLVVEVLGGQGIKEDVAVALLIEVRDYAPASVGAITPVKAKLKTNALKRAVAAAGQDMVQLSQSDADAEEVSQMAGSMVAEALRAGASVEVKSLAEQMQFEIEIMHRIDAGETFNVMGLRTGLQALDTLTCGLHGGEMIVVGARPSMGKSSLMNRIALEAALPPDDDRDAEVAPGVIFSLEMRAAEYSQRIVCSRASCNLQKTRMRLLNPDERQRYVKCARHLERAKIFIQDQGGLSMGQISATVRRLYHEHGIKWAIIDYLQLIDHGKNGNESDNSAITRTSNAIKALSLNMDIPIIALSQLNRDCERRDNKRPRLSDLRDSGSLEQDADVVMFLYRDWIYMSEDDQKNAKDEEVAEILVAKQRNGPIGTVRVQFKRSCASFGNLPDDFVAAEAGSSSGRMVEYSHPS